MTAPPEALVQRFREARRDRELAVLEGFQAVKHALRFGADVSLVLITDEARFGQLCAELAPDLPGLLARTPMVVPPDVVGRCVPSPPSTGVLGLARRPSPALDEALDSDAPVVFLESPTRLENIGAAVRVAAAAGAAALLTTGPHDPWHPSALRVGVGLHYAIHVAAVSRLPASDRPLVALHPEGEPLSSVVGTLPRRSVLAFGSERSGLSPDLLTRTDYRVRISMRSGVSSLNLATAVAVALYAMGGP